MQDLVKKNIFKKQHNKQIKRSFTVLNHQIDNREEDLGDQK